MFENDGEIVPVDQRGGGGGGGGESAQPAGVQPVVVVHGRRRGRDRGHRGGRKQTKSEKNDLHQFFVFVFLWVSAGFNPS